MLHPVAKLNAPGSTRREEEFATALLPWNELLASNLHPGAKQSLPEVGGI